MSKETEIKANVFEKIRTGEISMRRRTYFVARFVLLGTLSVAALILAMFVLSFAFFSIHESGERILLGFGQQGFLAFIALFPWWSLLLAMLLILLLDHLLRYFKFGYRVSILEIFLIALVTVMVAGILINFTPLHATLLNSADNDALPVLGPLYEQVHDSHQAQGVYRGSISSLQGNEFIIVHNDNDKDTDDGTSTIIVPPGFDTNTLQVGERVYIAGKLIRGVVHAYGIQVLPHDDK
jgi:hypothetical protein